MWRSKKFIIIAVLAAVILTGSIGSVALAAANGDDSQPGALFDTLWGKVAVILQGEGVDVTPEQLKAAFTEAKGELWTEAMQNRLQNRVEQGQITQEQADELQGWWQAKPEFPAGIGFRGHGGFRGMGGMHRFGGPCALGETE